MKKIVLFLMSHCFTLLQSQHHTLAPIHNNLEAGQRILIVSDSWNQIGGAESVIDQIKMRLEKNNHTVFHLDFSQVRTFKVHFWPNIKSPNPFGLKRTIAQKITAFKPDIVIITFLGMLSYIAGQYCSENNIPFTVFYPSRIPEICKAHLNMPLRISYYFVKNLLSKASRILVPTQSLKEDLQQRGIKNVSVWTHGVDLDVFKIASHEEKNTALRACNLLDKPRPFYLYVGRLSRAKNIQAFLDSKLPGTKILVGPQDYGYYLDDLKQKYPDIVFPGPKSVSELVCYYQCADIFLFPSKTDSFGLVQLEALASGAPVVAFDATGPRDVAPRGCGVSYLAKSDQELQKLALKAWEDRKEGLVTALQCRNHVQRFSWDSAIDELLHIAPRAHFVTA